MIAHQHSDFLDLFGDVIVTFDEIDYWCDMVTHGKFARHCRNFDNYVRNYDVINKIKRVKRRFYSLDIYFKAYRHVLAS